MFANSDYNPDYYMALSLLIISYLLAQLLLISHLFP